MAVTETTTTSYGQNLKNKFAAIGTGVVLFIASFVLLWISQAQTNYGKLAEKKSVAVAADTVNSANENNFISVTANLVSTEKLGDPLFIVPGSYLALTRTVEMYAWVEKSESKTTERVGGQTETRTTYWNEKEWVRTPANSSSFHEVPSPANPTSMPFEDKTFEVETATVGAFTLDPADNSYLPGASDTLTLNSENTILGSGRSISGDYIFQGRGSMSNPQIGDVRIRFTVLANPTYVTVFGKQTGSTIRRWTNEKREEQSLFRAIPGDRETAIGVMKDEFKAKVLILTIAGLLCMWIGLQMMFGFIPGLLQVIPFLKDASKFIIGLATLPIALVLGGLTILISFVAHTPAALIVTIVVIVALIIFLVTRKKQPAAA